MAQKSIYGGGFYKTLESKEKGQSGQANCDPE
jgi:hypothetical protein